MTCATCATCATCTYFKRPAATDRMASTGYGQCERDPVWLYRSPSWPCRTSPTHYREAQK